jgi:hypothetical protein
VANIEPGARIDVVIRYVQDLTYDVGMYEFVFPMVVGPRFNPGSKLPGPQSGCRTALPGGGLGGVGCIGLSMGLAFCLLIRRRRRD